jgi:hypothetical protein
MEKTQKEKELKILINKLIIKKITEEGEKNLNLNRNNPNYLHIKEVLEKIQNNSLKAGVMNYLLSSRKKAYFKYKILLEGKDYKNYLREIFLSDDIFSLENMFFVDINKNDRYVEPTPLKDENLEPLSKDDKSLEDFNIRVDKENKKRSIDYFNIRILNLFETTRRNILLEIDLSKPLDELQEILKLAKKSFDKKMEALKNNELIENNNILDDKLFEKMKYKRTVNIPLNEKLIDILFVVDCLLLEYKPKKIKDLLENYYFNFDSKISDIKGKYYERLAKEAKQIINKIIK